MGGTEEGGSGEQSVSILQAKRSEAAAGRFDYREVIQTSVTFPKRADSLVTLFAIGVLLNYITVVDDGSQEMGVLLIVPSLLMFGYLSRVGAVAAKGAEKPPDFQLSSEGIKGLLHTGVRAFVVVFPIFFGLTMVFVVLALPFMAVFGEGFVTGVLVYPIAAVVFVALLVTFPAAFVRAGFEGSIREAISMEALSELISVITTKQYGMALILFIVAISVANAVQTVLGFVPVVGGILGAAAMFYGQIAAFYIAGNIYRNITEGRPQNLSS